MDLRSIANGVSDTVNPNIIATVLASDGYTIGSGARQVPVYAAPVVGPAQVQALDGSELKQIEGLNIQGTVRAIYFRGILANVISPESKGGDLVQFSGQTWLVVKVLETWPLWSKAAIVLQRS